jgi:hypothetical protein
MDKDGYHGYDKDAEIKRLNEKIEFLARTNMLYSDWEHRETQVTSDLIRKGIEASRLNVELLSALSACLDWMEHLRTSGVAGNWDWEDDVYTKGRTIEAKLRSKNSV